jgi:hypothetical protein
LSQQKKVPELEIEIDYEAMEKICLMSIEDFRKINCKKISFERIDIENTFYYYANRGASILAVAHLDTVQPPAHFKRLVLPHRDLVFSPTLDDRLGVYVILDLLPNLTAHTYDILLTTDEERGQSSAQHFSTDKRYNWVFQFDRRGDDVALYQYLHSEASKKLPLYGLKPTRGSYSDIASLEHLGCFCMNVGVGYDNNHSLDAFADIRTLELMVRRFIGFLSDHHDKHLPYTPPVIPETSWWDEIYDTVIPYRKENDILYPDYYCRECGEYVASPDQFVDDWVRMEYLDACEEYLCLECFYQRVYGY